MEIINADSAVHTIKSNGTEVFYFLFDEYEIHYNTLPVGFIQEWHKHEKLEEVLYIIDGELTVYSENSDGTINTILVAANSVIRFEDTFHTLENKSDKPVRFLVYKTILHGELNKEIFASDKVLK